MIETNFQWTICLVLIALFKGIKSISEVTMRLTKNWKFDIWQKQILLRSLVFFWKMCSLSITIIEFYKIYKIFLNRDIRKLPIGEMFLKARNTFPYRH